MPQASIESVRSETQKTLHDMVDMTLKIKHELEAIDQLTSENGDLMGAVQRAKLELLRIAHIKKIPLDDPVEENNEDVIHRISVDSITQKLRSIME